MYIEDKRSREIGYGFVKKTNNYKKHIDWADIVVLSLGKYRIFATYEWDYFFMYTSFPSI